MSYNFNCKYGEQHEQHANNETIYSKQDTKYQYDLLIQLLSNIII